MSELVRRDYDGEQIVGVLTTDAYYAADGKGEFTPRPLDRDDETAIEAWAQQARTDAAEAAARARKTQAVIADAYAKLPDGALKDFAAALCVAVSDIETPESAKERVEDHPIEAAAAAAAVEVKQ